MDEALLKRATGVAEISGPQGARAWATSQGAHLLDWVPDAASPSPLFLSQATQLGAGASIRGGVPVIFPQFGAFGALPKHGFARRAQWTLVEQCSGRLAYELSDDEHTRADWPHAFKAGLTIRLESRALTVELDVTNTGDQASRFTAGLHTYLRVQDIAAVTLGGLGGRAYWDATDDMAHRRQDEDWLTFSGELDRVYPKVDGGLTLREAERVVEITASGFEDVVVWNPGPLKAAEMADMEPHGDTRMLCVEAAQIDSPIELNPGQHWRGSQTLRV